MGAINPHSPSPHSSSNSPWLIWILAAPHASIRREIWLCISKCVLCLLFGWLVVLFGNNLCGVRHLVIFIDKYMASKCGEYDASAITNTGILNIYICIYIYIYMLERDLADCTWIPDGVTVWIWLESHITRQQPKHNTCECVLGIFFCICVPYGHNWGEVFVIYLRTSSVEMCDKYIYIHPLNHVCDMISALYIPYKVRIVYIYHQVWIDEYVFLVSLWCLRTRGTATHVVGGNSKNTCKMDERIKKIAQIK